ncbi:hypothetical protein [Ancylomarina sp.]|uniref:hypothetical protein n=1 Tax=Ancylomarina sp. TaxID=1970196 RepID=UPI0035682E5D
MQIKDDLLAPSVELKKFRALKRVCHTCCDPAGCVESTFETSYEMVKLPNCPRRN